MSKEKYAPKPLPLVILAPLAAAALSAQTPLVEEGRAALSRGIGWLEARVVRYE
jgi:hypothetical protein